MKRYGLLYLWLGLACILALGACGDDRLLDVAKLSEQGEESVPELIALLEDKDWKVRREAAWALARIGPPARPEVQVLIAALGDEQEGVRYFSALALGDIGSVAAIPELAQALQDPSPYVRSVSAQSLGKIGVPVDDVLLEQADAIVPILIGALADGDDMVRGAAVTALQDIGTPQATEILESYDVETILEHYHSTCAGKLAVPAHICNDQGE